MNFLYAALRDLYPKTLPCDKRVLLLEDSLNKIGFFFSNLPNWHRHKVCNLKKVIILCPHWSRVRAHGQAGTHARKDTHARARELNFWGAMVSCDTLEIQSVTPLVFIVMDDESRDPNYSQETALCWVQLDDVGTGTRGCWPQLLTEAARTAAVYVL